MFWKKLFYGLCGRVSHSRRKSRRTPLWCMTPAIESLEQRVVPTYVTITQMPTYSTTGVGEVSVDTLTDPDEGTAGWTQRGKVQLADDIREWGTYETGSYASTGDLIFKINADEDDLVGSPVKVTLSFSGIVYYTDDPLGVTNTSTFRTTAGIDSPNEIVNLSGGHLSGPPQYAQAYTVSHTGDQRVIETTIGASITVHVHQDGYSEPWLDFDPTAPGNVLRGLKTGVVDSTLSVFVSNVERIQREIDVLTFDDDLADEDILGPYLENVSLSVKFDPYLTTTLSDEQYKITSATWQIGGFSGDLPVSDGFLNELVFDPKSLPPGNSKLKIIGYDSQHRPVAVTRKELQVKVVDTLDYQLQVKGKDGALIDVDDARFFEGIDAEVTFVGTIKDLPSYYGSLNPFKPQPHIIMNGVETDVDRISPSGAAVYKFEFTYDVSTLPVKEVMVDLKIGTVPISFFHDEAEKILVVKRPTWLNGGNPKYDEDTAEYKWTHLQLGLLKVEAPQLTKDLPTWLSKGLSGASGKSAKSMARLLDKKAKPGSSSSVTLDAFLNVVASINTELAPTYAGTSLVGKATLLGTTIWNKTYTGDGNVKIGGSLDAKTLDPQSFSISLDKPVVVDRFTLVKGGSIKINVLNKLAPALPDWLASVTLEGSISNTSGILSVNGGILLKKQGDNVVLDQSGTFLGLDNSIITATGSITADAKVGKGYILQGTVTGSLTPVVSVTLTAHFEGQISAPPRFADVNFKVSAKLFYNVKADVKSKLVGNLLHYDSAENGSEDDFLGPYKLIEYPSKA